MFTHADGSTRMHIGDEPNETYKHEYLHMGATCTEKKFT